MDTVINFSSVKYVAVGGSNTSIEVVVEGTTMSVPLDPANRHYAEILRQVAAGTLTIEDAD
jgi:hypothetical protein